VGDGFPARKAVALGLTLTLLGGCGDDQATEDPVPAHATVEALRGPWQPTPYVLDPQLLVDAQTECLAMNAAIPAKAAMPANAALVVADARGGGVLQLAFVAANGDGFECLNMPILPTGDVARSGTMTGRGGGGPIGPSAPFGMEALGGGSTTGGGNQPIDATVVGRVGPGIAQVQIEVAGQPRIIATIWNGWFAAWWPGSPRATAVGYDAAGKEVARIELE